MYIVKVFEDGEVLGYVKNNGSMYGALKDAKKFDSIEDAVVFVNAIRKCFSIEVYMGIITYIVMEV